MNAHRVAPARNGEIYVAVRTKTILACILHWILVLSIICLIITGFYIANPVYYYGMGEAYQAFAMANMRMIHFIAATILIFVLAVRIYIAVGPRDSIIIRDYKQFLPTPRNIVNAVKLAWYFLTGNGEHGQYRYINPLGGIGVFGMIVFMFGMVFTGFLLYLPGENPNTIWYSIAGSFTNMLGGQQSVRLLHHLMMYCLMFVIVIHIYMQIWKNTMFTESDISAIIGGYKVFPMSQIGRFSDYYQVAEEDFLSRPKEGKAK